MKIYTSYPIGVTKIIKEKEFYQTEDLSNEITVYVDNTNLTGITYSLTLEFLRADNRKTSLTPVPFLVGDDTTLTEDGVTYDIHNFVLTETQLAVAGTLAFTCYITIFNNSNVVVSRGALFNAVSNVRKTVTYSANTIFVVSEDDEDVPIIVADMKTAIETLAGQLASKVNKADVADNLTTNDSDKVLSAKQGYILKAMLDALEAATYTKTEVDSALSLKADKTTTYTKTEADNTFAPKSTAITHTGSQLQDYSGNNVYPNIDPDIYYNKTNIDDMVKTQAFYRNKTIINGVGWYVNYPYTFEKGCVYWLLYTGSDAQGRFRIVDENDAYHDDMQLSNGVMVRLVCSSDGVSVRWNAGTLTIIRESDVEKDSIEYKYLTEKFNNLVDFLGDVQLIESTQFDVSVSEYWNTEFDLNIPKGCFIETALLDYDGEYFSRFSFQLKDTSNTWSTIQNITTIGQKCIFYADKVYTRVRLQIYRTTIEHNVTAKFMWVSSAKDGFIKDALNPKTYYLKKDGTGDFTSIVTAINTVCNEKNATLYIGDGTWDIVDELGSTFMESVTNKKRGLYLKNGVHIICSSKSLIVAKYTGTNANTIEWFSAFNAGEGGFTLENATIESDNIRYTVHDERDEDADTYYNHYINCKMKHTNGFYVQCIGGGLGLDGHIIIDGCIFETDKTSSVALVSYHNCMDGGWTDAESKNAQSFVFIKNNYLGSKGFIQIIKMGKSQKITNAIITNNSLGSAVSVVNSTNYYWYDNVDVKQWNNEVRS